MSAPAGPRPHVCVVGDVGLDVLAKLAGPVVFGQDTRAGVRVSPGGAGGNTAAWLAGQDLDVSLIARVGDDEAGRSAAAELTEAGVQCLFAIDPQQVGQDGDRTMLADRGANKAFSPDDVQLPALDAGARGHLHLSGYVILDDSSRPAGLAALAAARSRGWTTSVDPQAAQHISAAGADTFLRWVDGVDVLLPNESEIAALGGVDAALGSVGIVVVTHGRHGASWYSADERLTVPVPGEHETDSTGAGDAFNAGLLGAWLAGAAPIAALTAGVHAGTAAAGRLGARPQR